ncbi:MAG: hypothetical protein AAF669_07435 [Pseudomonadota bacterium]
MKNIALSDTINLSELVHQADKEPVFLNQDGKKTGVILSFKKYESLTRGNLSNSKRETQKEKVSTIHQTLALRKKIESIENKEPSLSEEAYYQKHL